MAFPTGWTKRWAININADSVTSGVVTDWPCLVTDQHFPAEAWANLQATGADLRFSSDEAGLTELYYDAPRLDVAGQSAHLYVRVPSLLASEDTVIYGWCGNATATAPSAAWMQNTYHADIAAWWPMEEGTGTTVGDRTSNANHIATWSRMTPTWEADADGDYSILFPGTGYGKSTSGAAHQGSALSFLTRVYANATIDANIANKNSSYSAYYGWMINIWLGNFQYRFKDDDGNAVTLTKPKVVDAWVNVGFAKNSDGNITTAVNGDSSTTSTAVTGTMASATHQFYIGTYPVPGSYLAGKVASAAAFDDALSSDEIACHHLMLSDPATWATAGALESTGAGGPYLYHGRALGRIGPSMAGVR